MFRRWTPECTVAILALLLLGATALFTKSEAAFGALILQCGYCIKEMYEILKIRLGQKESEKADANEKV